MKKIIIAIIMAIVLIAVGFFCWLSSTLCGNQIIAEIVSPNSKYKAVIFERDCGATTDFSTQVSILKFKSKLKNKSGNIFLADSNHGKAKKQNKLGGPEVNAQWIDDQEIFISYSEGSRIGIVQTNFKNIKIKFKKE